MKNSQIHTCKITASNFVNAESNVVSSGHPVASRRALSATPLANGVKNAIS